MRKVLAITVALMIAAIVLSPALGYTNLSAGNQSYTATSGSRVNYSLTAGVPAHNLTQEMVANKYSLQAPAVQSTKVPYSIKTGSAQPYSVKLIGVTNAVREGYASKKAPARVGSAVATAETAAPTSTATPVEQAASAVNATTAPAVENATTAAPAPEPKFAIEGTVSDENQAALANITVNLEQPAGTVANSAVTDANGKFAFSDLAAGEYTVSEVVPMGMSLTAPADGKFTVTITNESITNLAFINAPLPAVTENATAPSNATVDVNTTEVAPVNTTAAA